MMLPPGAPPVTGGFPFIFSDESGVVESSATEPFYGIGMLKLSDAGRWSDDLNLVLDRLVSNLQLRAESKRQSLIAAGIPVPPKLKLPRSAYEFKFAKMTKPTRPFYEELVNYFIAQPDGYFCALVIDKTKPGVDPIGACGSSWDALITYSITLLRNNISNSERAIIIADNYQKPRAHPHYFERQLFRGLGAKAANVTMMDSSASILLQLVDVLLGCVMYHYKMPKLKNIDAEKRTVADLLASAYSITSFGSAGNFRRYKPNYFSVWPFDPKYRVVRRP